MRIISAAVSVVFASLMVLGEANGNTFRAVPARRTQTVLPDWPLARIISHAGLPRKEWCLAAKKGVSDGDPVGLEECDDPITVSRVKHIFTSTFIICILTYPPSNYSVSGIFDQSTLAAHRRWQDSKRLGSDPVYRH